MELSQNFSFVFYGQLNARNRNCLKLSHSICLEFTAFYGTRSFLAVFTNFHQRMNSAFTDFSPDPRTVLYLIYSNISGPEPGLPTILLTSGLQLNFSVDTFIQAVNVQDLASKTYHVQLHTFLVIATKRKEKHDYGEVIFV